jgi:hypothetical protein
VDGGGGVCGGGGEGGGGPALQYWRAWKAKQQILLMPFVLPTSADSPVCRGIRFSSGLSLGFS